jgi:hypothetical protein
MTLKQQLIILGNGFDLTCGLPTRYSDFFSNRYSKYHEVFSKILKLKMQKELLDIEFVKKYFQGITIWDCIFIFNTIIDDAELLSICSLEDESIEIEKQIGEKLNDIKWCDIEKIISDFFIVPVNSNSECLYYTQVWDHLITNIEVTYYEENINKIDFNGILAYIFSLLKNNSVEVIEKCGTNLDPTAVINIKNLENEIKQSSFDKFLLNELKRFERDFHEYLCEIFYSDSLVRRKYFNKAIRILLNISNYNKKISILNFNYTNPMDSKLNREYLEDDLINFSILEKNIICITNVHGYLSELVKHEVSERIFGIDESVFFNNELQNICYSEVGKNFTKTSRKIHANNNYYTPESYSGRYQGNLLSKNIHEIIFFGHSLSEADYSYFMSIFDFLDIYNSEVSLIFYYYDHEKEIDKVKNITTENVKNLIRKYAITLENMHSENLLHKLLLENRLKILEYTKEKLEIYENEYEIKII